MNKHMPDEGRTSSLFSVTGHGQLLLFYTCTGCLAPFGVAITTADDVRGRIRR